MAIMIPDQIPDDAPRSEKTVFENLMRAPQARDWVVFHSIYVDNPRNPTKPLEIDFLILIPEYCSVICLEVKGGSYKITGGQWSILPNGPDVASPLDQARDAMFGLKAQFKSSYFRSESLLSIVCAVAFTDGGVPSGASLPKHLALMIESRDARDASRLGSKLEEHARTELNDPFQLQLTQIELDNLRRDLEPDVMIEQRPETIFRSDLETLRPQLLRLTTDQLNSLKRVGLNDRCVIDGAAGTGKTVLAMELARQRCKQGETVALLCSNPNLSYRFDRWTKTLPKDSGGRVVASTPATLPFWAFRADDALKDKHKERLASSPGLEESLKRGYHLDDKWPSFIDETVEDLGEGGVFDYLIVDEAQNLCDEMFLKLMNVLLKGGLAEGHWSMFGDFTNQNLISPRLTEDGKEVLRNLGLNWSNDKLETNCRNTYEIAADVAKFVDIESPPMSGVHGPLVQIEYFKSPEELGNMLDNLIGDWQDREFQSEQIILLSSGFGGEFNTERTYSGWKLLNIRKITEEVAPKDKEGVLIPRASPLGDTLRYSDVYDFQGLESDLAILVLPVTEDQVILEGNISLPREKHLNRVLYTGMSRAKTMLVIVAHESYKAILKLRAHSYNKLKALQATT